MQVETGNVLPEANERKRDFGICLPVRTSGERKQNTDTHGWDGGSVEIGRHLTKF